MSHCFIIFQVNEIARNTIPEEQGDGANPGPDSGTNPIIDLISVGCFIKKHLRCNFFQDYGGSQV